VLKRLDDLKERAKTSEVLDRKLFRDFLLDKDMYLAAYQKLRSNPGSMTPGINPTTLDGLSLSAIEDIIKSLTEFKFEFSPGRRIEIRKANGKKRPITIGNPREKLVQEIIRMVLEAIYEPMFLETSHGFRPKRGCHTALRTVFSKFRGCAWWIEGDIQSCFDSIPHNSLMEVLERRIKDRRFLDLIRKALNAGYLSSKIWKTDIVGTPQGSIISPILANIYLHDLDVYIEKLKENFDSTSTARPRGKEWTHTKYLLTKAREIQDPKLRRKQVKKFAVQLRSLQSKVVGAHSRKLMYVRYADDWIIAINGSYKDAVQVLEKVRKFCAERGLTVSEEKTKITNSYIKKILFLGTHIKHSRIHTFSRRNNNILQRNTRGLILTAPMGRIRKKLTEAGFISNNRAQTRLTWVPLSPKQMIHLGNQILRGYWNFYSFAHNKMQFTSWTYYIIRDVIARTLARKFKLLSRASVYKKYGSNLSIYSLTKRDANKVPTLVARLVKPNYSMNVWDFKISKVDDNIPELYSNKVSIASLEGLVCTVCKSEYRVEMHHVRMMKDLSPKTKRLDYLMARANRKQIPLCRSCHVSHHRGDLIIPKSILEDKSDS
jgi:group II intron reverse transcriptase/maturase